VDPSVGFGEEKNPFTLTGTQTPDRPARRRVAVLSTLKSIETVKG